MARFKKLKSRARRLFGRKKGGRSSRNSGVSVNKLALGCAAYGAVRAPLHGFTNPWTSKLSFLGQYHDEVAYALAGYYMAKKMRGLGKVAGISILAVEASQAGAQLAGGLMGGATSAPTTGQWQ